ncbi:ROK family glucokinase [Sediminibacillus dalangtanensis]|uniref:Glucokinase n=1 Tax=Sediminibacillus dalangtanensis TaxID=2729421 RepID=A0ABX7VSH6_9BACI|nr:ROK family glucokinase [Sediminibacillus dalangtanensis]QTM99824.1 ROK family glucokinase [Sediminibacillus dalangtanensis]
MAEKYAVGVDIGGTTVKLAIIKETGDIVEKWEIKTNLDNNGSSIPEDIWSSVEQKLKTIGLRSSDLIGIGAGAPGFVDTDTGDVAVAVNIGWKDFALAEKLEKLSDLPAVVDNDANIAALGENWLGAGNQAENLVAVTIGTGVGGGIIANGQVINGVNGTAGEIGHITVETDGAPCNCGRKGCLETVASATGIARQAEQYIESDQETILATVYKENGNVTAKDVFESAAAGDKASEAIIDRVTDVLGLAIANSATVVNPSKIVIGGGVSKAGEQLLIPLRKAFDKYALPRISEAAEFVTAKLGNDAGVIGAAYLVTQGRKG